MMKIGPITFFETDDIVSVSIDASMTMLEPELLQDDRWDETPFAGKRVRIRGAAPLWLYSHLAYRAVRMEAVHVEVFQPQLDGYITVYPTPEPEDAAARPTWYRLQETGAVLTLEFEKSDTKWPVDILVQNPVSLPSDIDALGLTGSGANWMYAAVAAKAAANRIDNLIYDSPRESFVISIGAVRPGSRLIRNFTAENGLVVGIVGDPNSGKSVISEWLETVVHDVFPKSWRFDCDFASPTSNWFRAMLRNPSPETVETGKLLREGQKRPWSPELERSVAGSLCSLKQSLDLTLADLPGGNHKATPPQRIPPGREIIMREIDLFLILGREDKPEALQAWREALRAHGLESRIFAEIVSGNPEAEPSFETWRDGKIVKGIARGLRRENDIHDCTEAIQSGASELLRHWLCWKPAVAARAATTRAFLTKPGGIRYGAAVLSRHGNIDTAGQY